MKYKYQVIVGNIGTVYDGGDWNKCVEAYREYVSQSCMEGCRASGEPVTIMRNGEPYYEHSGTLATS